MSVRIAKRRRNAIADRVAGRLAAPASAQIGQTIGSTAVSTTDQLRLLRIATKTRIAGGGHVEMAKALLWPACAGIVAVHGDYVVV